MSPWVPRALLAVGGIALVAAVVSIAVGEGGPQPEDVGGVNDVQRIFGGIPQEGAYLGAADAETTVTVFNDIQCEPCADYEVEVIDPLLEEYARGEEVRFEFRHFSLAPNDTTLAAIASEAAGEQARQWQYIDTFVRNQDLAAGRDVDEPVLREIAEAVPQLEVDEWERDFDSPRSEELVREDAMLAAELELTADPAVVVAGPTGQRELTDLPSGAEVEAAIDQVS
jgi:protein-disulfide isomerase